MFYHFCYTFYTNFRCQINQKHRSYQILNITTEGFTNISCSKPLKRTLLFSVVDERELFDKSLICQIYQPNDLPNIVNTIPSKHFIFLKNNDCLTDIIRNLIEKAIISSCYKPVLLNNNSSIYLNGDNNLFLLVKIRKFWLTPDWKTIHRIALNLILFDANTNNHIKEKLITVEYGKFIGIWNNRDFEELINKNMEEIYGKLIEFLSSEEFVR